MSGMNDPRPLRRTKTLLILLSVLWACGEPSNNGADLPGVAGPTETAGAPVCQPDCPAGVCRVDGCGSLCPACASLPTPYGDDCSIEGKPAEPSAMTVEPAFQWLSFTWPVQLTHAGDGSDRLFVVEKKGRIKVFPNNPNVTSGEVGVFLDLSDRVNSGPNEAGLLSVAFHPSYANNGRVFVNYTGKLAGKLTTFVSEFHVSGNDPNQADPNSEIVLMTVAQPFSNHNGGQVAMGPDGHLYIAHGDGGSAGDPYGHSQSLTSLLGKMLRIDVDTVSDGNPYGIPADNPFVGMNPSQARPEIFAWGLRNAWRFSFDRLTGQLWAADVGQDAWEEVDIVTNGRNYGWNIMEGTHCFKPAFNCDEEGLEPPVLEYPHSVGESITGGHVYRGAQDPGLFGAYVYGDYVSGAIFAARYEEDEDVAVTPLAQTNLNISAFGEDEAGELFVVHYSYFQPSKGRLYRLIPKENPGAESSFPLTLSETGCFSDLASLQPAQGLLSYTVNAPLWHDGAQSIRYLALPPNGIMDTKTPGAWSLPSGTRLLKTFVYDQAVGPPVRVETRILLVEDDGVHGYSYQWNDDQTDAVLLSADAEKSFVVDGQSLTWHYPSRSQCLSCHTEAAGGVLGWHTGQLNREHTDSGVTTNQLFAWEHMALVSPEFASDVVYPSADEATASVSSRARAALFSNCAGCHQPGASPTTDLDLRYETPLNETGTCFVKPDKGDLGVEDAMLIKPGEPNKSTVYLRMNTLGFERMPNLGSFVIDTETVALVKEWIESIAGCNAP